jgi:hypothetical protein
MVVFLGAKDVAGRLGVSERHATRLMKSGQIPSFPAGVKLWRTTELHLASFAERRILEQQGLLPKNATGSGSSSGLPQSHVKVIPVRPARGLVIGRTAGSRQRKPA